MSAKVENTLNQLKVLFLCGLSVMLIYAGRVVIKGAEINVGKACLLYTSPSPRDRQKSRMPSSA